MTPLQEFWHYFKRNKGAVVGLVYVVIVLFIAILPTGLHPITQRNSSAMHCFARLGRKAAAWRTCWALMTWA